MKKPIILDLYCGAGGAGEGYERAGFDVVGVDKYPQPNYPYKFIQADAIEYLEYCHYSGHKYSAIHASPPCQDYTPSTAQFKAKGKKYVNLIPQTRNWLNTLALPSIIENVPQADIRPDIVLRGDMLGLKVIKTRHFELLNWFALNPMMPQKIGKVISGEFVCIYGKASYKKVGNQEKGIKPKWSKDTIRETWQYAMGINHHMTDVEISESIPPAYTEYIGKLLMERL